MCEDLGMPLVTHVGSGMNARYSGLESVPLLQIESGRFTSRRAVWWLIFAGVFERHPGLKLVITETPGSWFPTTADELDALWRLLRREARRAAQQGPSQKSPIHRPSEYMASQRLRRRQLRVPFRGRAGRHCTARNPSSCRGSDYPHLEGTFVNPEEQDDGVRHTAIAPPHLQQHVATRGHTSRWSEENAIRHLRPRRRTALQAVADEIGAPTSRSFHPDRRGPRRGERDRVPIRGRRLELNPLTGPRLVAPAAPAVV